MNLTSPKNPSILNCHISIKKSQAILKFFIDLKFSVCFTLCSENETMFCDTLNFFQLPLSSFPFPDFSSEDRSDSASGVDCRSFTVLTILTGSRPKKF